MNDLADAHILALDHLQGGADSDVFNLGNGNGYSVKEVIEVARQMTGREIPVKTAGRRAGDPAVLVAGADKARDVLNWEPKLCDVKTIIQTAWKWQSGAAREWKKTERKSPSF